LSAACVLHTLHPDLGSQSQINLPLLWRRGERALMLA